MAAANVPCEPCVHDRHLEAQCVSKALMMPGQQAKATSPSQDSTHTQWQKTPKLRQLPTLVVSETQQKALGPCCRQMSGAANMVLGFWLWKSCLDGCPACCRHMHQIACRQIHVHTKRRAKLILPPRRRRRCSRRSIRNLCQPKFADLDQTLAGEALIDIPQMSASEKRFRFRPSATAFTKLLGSTQKSAPSLVAVDTASLSSNLPPSPLFPPTRDR